MITKKKVQQANLKLEEASLKLEYLSGNTSGINQLLREVQAFLDQIEAETPEQSESEVIDLDALSQVSVWTLEDILAREG